MADKLLGKTIERNKDVLVKGAKSKALKGRLDTKSGARDVTKSYKKIHPESSVHGVHDVMRK